MIFYLPCDSVRFINNSTNNPTVEFRNARTQATFKKHNHTFGHDLKKKED